MFGIFRPVLLLPDGMAGQLSTAEWTSSSRTSCATPRCFDNLTAAIYTLVETIFWFHPLV